MRITFAVNASDPRPLGGAGSTRFTARGDDLQHLGAVGLGYGFRADPPGAAADPKRPMGSPPRAGRKARGVSPAQARKNKHILNI